jgi:hypothetical protein
MSTRPKPYKIHTLEVCEDLSQPDKTFEYNVTVGHEAPEHYSPDDKTTAYHYEPAEWVDLLLSLDRGEFPPVGNDITIADGYVVRVLT